MALTGRIVEYIEQGKFICGLALEEENRRLRLLNQNGREIKLPLARVLHQTARSVSATTREAAQELLQEVNRKRHDLGVGINLEELWELVSGEGKEAFTPEFLAGLSFGTEADEDQVAAFLRAVLEDRFFFKFREGRIVVHPQEVVGQMREKAAQARAEEQFLAECAAGLAGLRRGERPVDSAGLTKCLQILADHYLFGGESATDAQAREIVKLGLIHSTEEIHQLLVTAGYWQPHENLGLRKHQVPVAFSAEALAEAAAIQEPTATELLAEGYRDFSDLPLLTIDGESTRDYDDALHIERRGTDFLVGIHVADVARYVRPGSALFAEARQRATTLYFPDSRVPMLPEALSEGVCSLICDRPRPVTSIMVQLSATGEVLDYSVRRALVKVRRQLSYPYADQHLESDQELRDLANLARLLRERRIAGGALLMPIPDVLIEIAADGGIAVRLADGDSGARALVAEFMVLANTLFAAYVADRQVPGLFRGQNEPHRRLFQGFQRDLQLNFRQRRFLQPARITTRAQPHSCVGTMQYTTMTSPIRRFFDLVMQHQVANMLRGQGARFQEHELEGFIAELIRLQSRAGLVRRLRHRYWLLRYLEPRVGERLEALVVDRGPRRVNVVLTEILMEADLPVTAGVSAEPGAKVMVRLARVKPLEDLLRLEW
ncbi:MAG: RNB domain-containing ribonuclease [Desulfobulbaceae bacterium]|nr:RNB domain-containing ribonuclease [Desulfobulbaceae bacterium]